MFCVCVRAFLLSEHVKSTVCFQSTSSMCAFLNVCTCFFCFFSDDGKVVKAVSVIKDNWETEEIILEELTVFQVRYSYQLSCFFLNDSCF